MDIENYIEFQYRELLSSSQVNAEFSDLYATFEHQRLREIFMILHYDLISLFRTMNERLPSGENGAHFWADPSRSLISLIEITLGLFNALKNTKYAIDIDEYYYELIKKCRDFLSSSGGSLLPANMPKIELYYTIPIFKQTASINVTNNQNGISFELKQIGSGSYANVFKYKDTFYNRLFALKRAKKELTDKEMERFKREFEEMEDFSSPYILEVYCYNVDKNEYITEYMDYTLDRYLLKYNASMSIAQRKGVGKQILRAFDYIHSKGRLHRDISPKNILIKEYDDVVVVKIADFGLVKTPDSFLTTANTEFKGYFNDPSLIVDGFNTYSIQHETFALTRIIYYVMTGKTNTDEIPESKLTAFVQVGLNADKSKRFQSVGEMVKAFRSI